jgi:glutathione synthase/RimK-type ligase-like ATP-grasp enzyme
MKIAFIGYRKQEKYSVGSPKDEDKVLLDLFAQKGLDVEAVIWNDPAVNWKKYDTAILKSPWDYHERFPDFMAWLDRLEALNIALLNPSPVVRWNIDKHYLNDIAEAGLAVIPSLFLEKNTRPALSGFFSKFNTSRLVIKPCVSASARQTLVVIPENASERQEQLHTFLQNESFLIQPFMEEIVGGELSFIFLGNRYSHSVLKLPKQGDFRVQHFHGGTVRTCNPKEEQIKAAQAFVDRFAAGCLYARVDGLVINGTFQLMELELIEPYLFLDTSPGAYERYYEALLRVIGN